jgi:hypothetical protein
MPVGQQKAAVQQAELPSLLKQGLCQNCGACLDDAKKPEYDFDEIEP